LTQNIEARVNAGDVLAIVNTHQESLGSLIAILEDIQERYGYLPEAALRLVARTTGRSLVDVYGVATFYRAFSLKPRGKHHICACLGTACHVRGGPQVVEELERQLQIKRGETTPDGEFTLETVNCLGACALGPIVTADKTYYSHVDAAGVKKLIQKTAAAGTAPEPRPQEAEPGQTRLTASTV